MKMVKVSIISSLYNAEKYIYGLFLSLRKQEKINKKEFEVIILDDGSTDSTAFTIEKYKYLLSDYCSVRVIKSKVNKGLGKKRYEGAKAAKGKHIIFVDAKTRPDKDYLFQFVKIAHSTVVGNVYIDKNRSIWDRFNHILRIFIYRPYYGVDFEDVSLNYEQYEKFKAKGGGGALWTKKDYFIRANKGIHLHRHMNDDSMIIGELSKIEPIIRSSKPKVKYLSRKGFFSNMKHTFLRGPKFVAYYFKRGSRYYIYILSLIFFLLINILFLILKPKLILIELLLVFIANIVMSVILASNFKDFLSSFLLLPCYLISFSLGVLRGLFIKLAEYFKK